MKSLYEFYSNNNKSYYSIPIPVDKLFKSNDFKEGCKTFIFDHFKYGKKQQAMQLAFEDEYNMNGKHVHTVSLFLLGLSFKDMFSDKLKRKLSHLIPHVNSWYDYAYSWFLTCLYHDVASCIEKNSKYNEKDFETLIDDIENYYEHKPIKKNIKLNRFDLSTIKNYYHYKKECRNSMDHGIYAGFLLFNKLKENFLNKTKGYNIEKEKVCIDGLLWRIEHLDHFAYISDAIVCHNIWMSYTETDKERYKQNGLEELIIDSKSKKLSFNRFPLQFMLCLLDSIEPTKKLSQTEPYKLLENIFIERNGNKIVIEWNDCIKEDLGFFDWMKSIKELPKWMDVSVDGCNCGCKCNISITINDMQEHK